jgi:hypothetical protein
MSKHAQENAAAWLETLREHVARLRAAEAAHEASGYDSREAGAAVDAVREEITESPLSVMVRDGWRAPGAKAEDGAEEYEILLSTGGPALRLVGDLDGGEPNAWPRLEWQDWGTPWTEYEPARAFRKEMQAWASCFYFED